MKASSVGSAEPGVELAAGERAASLSVSLSVSDSVAQPVSRGGRPVSIRAVYVLCLRRGRVAMGSVGGMICPQSVGGEGGGDGAGGAAA